MNHSPARSHTTNERSRLRWVLGGSLVLSMSWLGACSSGDSPAQNGTQQNPPVECVSPEVTCAGSCVNLSNNSLHCGSCGEACGAGEICQGSACVMGSCPSGTETCNGACVDTQTNASNCGACGAACPAGQSCLAGGCVGGGSGGTGGATGGTGGATGGTGGATGGAGGSGGSAGTTAGAGGGAGMDSVGGSAGMDATGGTAGTGMGGTAGAGAGAGGSAGEPPVSGDCRVWVAPGGSDTAAGTEAAPFATLLKAYDTVCPKPPDGTENGAECLGASPRTVCLKTGSYTMTERLEFKKTRMGTEDNRITVRGAPGLSLAERPVLDFRTQERLACGANPDNIGGLTVNAHYVTIRDLVVRGANDNCILVQGTQGLVENVLTYECADTGIQISAGGEYDLTGTNNTVRNCDSHSNYDVQCEGENADGFAIKEGTGTGNAFIGCRAWNNTDDGFDFYGWTSPVRLENSWAVDQCASNEDTGSDCNGFKLGGDGISAAHQLRDLFATGNSRATGNGFTENSNPASMTCMGSCASWGNKVNVDSIMGVSTTAPSGATVANMKADGARNADGTLKAVTGL